MRGGQFVGAVAEAARRFVPSAGAALALLASLSAVPTSCTSTAPPAADLCLANGGACVTTTDTVACGSILSFACSSAGFTCCSLIDAGPGVDASVPDAMPSAPSIDAAPLFDAGGGADPGSTHAGLDAGTEAHREAGHDDAGDAMAARHDAVSEADARSDAPIDGGARD
jgi:hypothetical protein